MPSDAFEVLTGLRLSIVRRAADMLMLHFGDVRPHQSGSGTVGAYALHVQCPWRLDGPDRTITGSSDLWAYAGSGEHPANWSYEDGLSLQDRKLDETVGSYDAGTRSWYNKSGLFTVTAALLKPYGEVELQFSGGYTLAIFPAGSAGEAWRFFATDSKRHLVYPGRS
jgi:hypothetical protein